jgi:hypothetical protein
MMTGLLPDIVEHRQEEQKVTQGDVAVTMGDSAVLGKLTGLWIEEYMSSNRRGSYMVGVSSRGVMLIDMCHMKVWCTTAIYI